MAAATKLSDQAIEDIRSGRLSLRAFAKLYGVHHTSVLRVTQPRAGDGHKRGYYHDYHLRNKDERCREERERIREERKRSRAEAEVNERRYWALWVIRAVFRAWGLNTDLTGVNAPTWGTITFDPCGRPTGRAISRSCASITQSSRGAMSRVRLNSSILKEAHDFTPPTLK